MNQETAQVIIDVAVAMHRQALDLCDGNRGHAIATLFMSIESGLKQVKLIRSTLIDEGRTGPAVDDRVRRLMNLACAQMVQVAAGAAAIVDMFGLPEGDCSLKQVRVDGVHPVEQAIEEVEP